MQTPEGKVKNEVKKILTKYKAYYYMPVPGGYGAPTLDFICCHNGQFFSIETKAPGKIPTPRQVLTIREMKKAGAMVFVIDGETGYAALALWLEVQQ